MYNENLNNVIVNYTGNAINYLENETELLKVLSMFDSQFLVYKIKVDAPFSKIDHWFKVVAFVDNQKRVTHGSTRALALVKLACNIISNL